MAHSIGSRDLLELVGYVRVFEFHVNSQLTWPVQLGHVIFWTGYIPFSFPLPDSTLDLAQAARQGLQEKTAPSIESRDLLHWWVM